MATNFSDTVTYTGTVDVSNATNFLPKDASITNGALTVSPIQIYQTNFDIAIGSAPAAREEIVLVARSAGTINFVYAGLNDTGTATVSCDFDLNINGTTALSADINVDHDDADRDNVAGTLSTTTLAAGDVVSCSLESVTANDSQGPFMVFGVTWTASAT